MHDTAGRVPPFTFYLSRLQLQTYDAQPATASGSSSKQASCTSSTAPQSSDMGTALVATSSTLVPLPPTGSLSSSMPSAETTDPLNSNAEPQDLSAVVGGAFGGAIFLTAIDVLCVYLFLKRKYSCRGEDASSGTHDLPLRTLSWD